MRWLIKASLEKESIFHQFSPTEQALIIRSLEKSSINHEEQLAVPWLDLSDKGVLAYLPSLKKPYRLSLDEGQIGRRVAQSSETLCRVTGASRGQIISIHDATAGICREAHLMASCGAIVSANERSLPLYLMAKDALFRAQSPVKLSLAESGLSSVIAHVIYLDPMFPKSSKRAAIGKEAALLRAFAQRSGVEDEVQLLEWGLDNASCRVVVKRPMKAEYLGKRTPTASVRGKAIRFDIYGKSKLPKRSNITL